MKKNLNKLIMLMVFTSFALVTTAQKTESTKPLPKWISKHGYWVIESNKTTPKASTIFFYTNNNVLVYTEKVDGVKLNVKRRKTLMKLKEVLDESLIAWRQNQPVQGEQLVKNIFKEY